ncbi:hypothetical protein PENSTE_c018G05621 [Penicillium steckii]|uniref:Zn(2)-C6 fungal-type domain-containing protein n=1 Tax=Penicillium steckii TaxID=303698 RepID=A0A1V6SXJ6_9EURO|nr:hypothetical protein PENSTE_c018G05621 [Penicillium steckii]
MPIMLENLSASAIEDAVFNLKKSTRRKACNACVQAKAKCSYARPCARCIDRDISCIYASASVSASASASEGPSNLNFSSPPLEAPNFIPVQPPVLQPATQGVPNLNLPPVDGFGNVLPSTLLDFQETSLGDLDVTIPIVQHALGDLIHVVEQYPKSLLRDDFISPLLHRTLYEQDVPDMTTLARTSMAICCGSAMETIDGSRFARQAMEVERQRLIRTFPTYTCMQQWDALHAMLIYGILELRTLHGEARQGKEWKQKSYSQGLKAPFLAKMTRSLINSHIQDPITDLMLASRPKSRKWEDWAVGETTRRIIFLANIVYYLGHCDPKNENESGSPSSYYEPLNDELILNMPLPCSHALWTARTETEWELTMDFVEQYSTSEGDSSTIFDLSLGRLTLKDVIGSHSRDYLQTLLTPNTSGVGGSDELRSLIILCALHQFT